MPFALLSSLTGQTLAETKHVDGVLLGLALRLALVPTLVDKALGLRWVGLRDGCGSAWRVICARVVYAVLREAHPLADQAAEGR
jgi:hypothetical protein